MTRRGYRVPPALHLQRKDDEFSYRLLHADGSSVWVRDIVTVDPDKGVEGRLRGMIVNITAQKRAEERLATSEPRFRDIIERVGVLAVQLDVQGSSRSPTIPHSGCSGQTSW